MSSTYRPICLNHNPAIVLDPELTYDEAKTLGTRDRFQGHEQCDLVIGRYSYPMVEVACLGRDFPGPTGCKSYHGGIQWTDRSWLRLLLAAAPSIDAELLRPLFAGCWPLERLERLRVELDLPAQPDTDDNDTGLTAARPGIPRCTATWHTSDFGTFTCWRAATHNREISPQHAGESAQGWRFAWLNTDTGTTTPHTDTAKD